MDNDTPDENYNGKMHFYGARPKVCHRKKNFQKIRSIDSISERHIDHITRHQSENALERHCGANGNDKRVRMDSTDRYGSQSNDHITRYQSTNSLERHNTPRRNYQYVVKDNSERNMESNSERIMDHLDQHQHKDITEKHYNDHKINEYIQNNSSWSDEIMDLNGERGNDHMTRHQHYNVYESDFDIERNGEYFTEDNSWRGDLVHSNSKRSINHVTRYPHKGTAKSHESYGNEEYVVKGSTWRDEIMDSTAPKHINHETRHSHKDMVESHYDPHKNEEYIVNGSAWREEIMNSTAETHNDHVTRNLHENACQRHHQDVRNEDCFAKDISFRDEITSSNSKRPIDRVTRSQLITYADIDFNTYKNEGYEPVSPKISSSESQRMPNQFRQRYIRDEYKLHNNNESVHFYGRGNAVTKEWNDRESDKDFGMLSHETKSKYSTGKSFTMHDARKISRHMDLREQKNYELSLTSTYDSTIKPSDDANIAQISLPVQERRLWAKDHWNSINISHLFSQGLLKTSGRKNILQSASTTAKEKNTWHRKKKKAKGKVTESLKSFFSKVQIWSSSMKFIEGHFGTSVVSYFLFLRWLLFLNLCIFVAFFVFIVVPQAFFEIQSDERNITTAPQINTLDSFVKQLPVLSKHPPEKLARVQYSYNKSAIESMKDYHVPKINGDLGSLLNMFVVPGILDASLNYDKSNHTQEERIITSKFCHKNYIDFIEKNAKYDVSIVIQDFFQGTGWMESTLMFSGHYVPLDLVVPSTNFAYNIPVAFLAVLLALYIVCLIMMVNYASKGVRETLLSAESSVQSYCSMVFCAWDYCVESTKTATLKHNSIVLELKSNLAEARRQAIIAQWTTLHKIKIYLIRFFVNIFVISALVGTYFLMYNVSNYQLKEGRVGKHEGFMELLIQFLPSITITALNFIMPVVFDVLVRHESFGVQTAINITLVRTIFVRLASIVILVVAFHHQIKCEPKGICRHASSLGNCPTLLCWETYVGQQMYKLVMLDFIVTVGVTLFWEVPRNFVVQRWRCKVTKVLGRQTFDVPSQVLSLVYSQTLCWLGMFYSPLLPSVCVIQTILLFYIKKFTLTVNCVPSQTPYRASRSNAVFVIVLMLNFFITIAVLGYTVSNVEPSPGCSPFRYYDHMIDAIRDALNVWTPEFSRILRFIFSAGFAVPVMIVLCLAGYYYLTVTAAHKRMIKELKSQLVLEGQDKQFLLNRLTEVACQGVSKENC